VSDDHPDHQLFATFTAPHRRLAKRLVLRQLNFSGATDACLRAGRSAAIASKRSPFEVQIESYETTTARDRKMTKMLTIGPPGSGQGMHAERSSKQKPWYLYAKLGILAKVNCAGAIHTVTDRVFQAIPTREATSHPHSPTHDAACVYEPFRGM
jgi:hypothetical protein